MLCSSCLHIENKPWYHFAGKQAEVPEAKFQREEARKAAADPLADMNRFLRTKEEPPLSTLPKSVSKHSSVPSNGQSAPKHEVESKESDYDSKSHHKRHKHKDDRHKHGKHRHEHRERKRHRDKQEETDKKSADKMAALRAERLAREKAEQQKARGM